MIFDADMLKQRFGIHQTQLNRWRDMGLNSIKVEVLIGSRSTQRRLYDLAEIAGFIAKHKLPTPKGMKHAAEVDAGGIVAPEWMPDDDEPPPVPDTEAARAFVLGFACGFSEGAGTVLEVPRSAERMQQNLDGYRMATEPGF